MKRWLSILLVVLLLLTSLPLSLSPTVASGATNVFISDSFDTYSDKNAAIAVWGRLNGSVDIVAESEGSINKVARVPGSSGDLQIRSTFPHYALLNSADLTSGKVAFSADFKAASAFIGKILGFKVGSSMWYQPLELTSTGVKSMGIDVPNVNISDGQWHNLIVILDTTDRTAVSGASVFLDGKLLTKNVSFIDGSFTGVQFTNATAGTTYDIDNFKVFKYTEDPSITTSFKVNESVVDGVYATEVPISGAYIDVTFSNPFMNASTFNANTLIISSETTTQAAISYTGSVDTSRIALPSLLPNTTYTLSVTDGVESVFGQKVTPNTLYLTTADPSIVSNYKINGVDSTGGNTEISIHDTYVDIAFSGVDVNSATINADNITISPTPPGAVNLTSGTNSCKIEFATLAPATTYTVTVTDGVKDIYGKGAISSNFSFTTSSSTITASYELNGKTVGLGNIGIPLTGSYAEITFSNSDMNSETFNSSNITLSPAAPGAVSFSGTGDTCRIDFSELAHSTTYTVTLTDGVESSTGEKVTPGSFTFTTVGVEKPGEQDIAAIYLNEEFTNYIGGTPSGWAPSTSSLMTAATIDEEHGVSYRATANAANKDINISKSFAYPIDGNVVLETKVYPEETDNQRALFVLKDTFGGENFLVMMDGGGKIVTMPDETQFATYNANEWYNFQVVVNMEANKFDVYINGVKKLSERPLPELAIENISSITIKSWNGGSSCYDDIRVYEGTAPLTEEQFDELLSRQDERLTEEDILNLKLQNAVVLCAGTKNAIVNNVKMKINEESSLMPVVIDEKIYVPASYVLQKLNINKEFTITAGQKNYVFDGMSGSFFLASIAGAGDVLVPAQEFAEVIGKEIYISGQGLVVFSDIVNIFNPLKDAYTLKNLFTHITYNAIDTSLITDEVYKQLRDKWKQRSIGDGTHDMTDPDIKFAVESANAAAQAEWNSMVKGGSERAFLWDSCKGTTLSADVTTNYNKLKKMVVAYTLVGGELYQNQDLKADILSALDWLNDNRYSKNIPPYENWWEWQIGTPQILNDILVLMYDDLSDQQIIENTDAIDYYIPKVPDGDSGANLVWRAMAIAVRAIVAKDANKVIEGRDALVTVFDYTDRGDGFYEDGSFIQHVKHSYTMGYGKSMLGDLSSAMYFFENTLFEISNPSKNNIYDWIMDGFEPLMYKGAAMSMASGREISRDYDDHYIGNRVIRSVVIASMFAPENLKPWLQSMAKGWIVEDTARNFFESCPFNVLTEAKKIVQDESIPVKDPLVLYKQYAAMDEAVMRRDGFAFAVTMSSSRIGNFESFSGENLKSWYQNDGVTYIYNELEQYSNDYFPTINPYRLPGITVDTRIKADGEYAGKKPQQDFVGGVEIEELFGASAMQLDAYNSSLEAKKSWFVFDDEIVALGTDINSNEPYDVLTIVENRQLNQSGNNNLTVNGATKSSEIGYTESVADTQWAHLQGNEPGTEIGYFFPQAVNVNFLREQRTGTWYDINTKYGSKTPVTKNYLNIWLDHGNLPQNASYAYVLLPNKTPEQTAQYSTNPHIQILRNDESVQAVHEINTNATEYIFWQSGEEGIVKSNNPAAVGLRVRDHKLIVSASDPTQKQQKIVIEINKPSLVLESKDEAVTVTETATGVQLEINTLGSIGKTFEAVFSYDNLTGLEISKGSITPAFDPAITSYTANVANEVSSLSVTASVYNQEGGSYPSIKINGESVVSGEASELVNLEVGSNNLITIDVISQDQSAKTYTLRVTRAAASEVNDNGENNNSDNNDSDEDEDTNTTDPVDNKVEEVGTSTTLEASGKTVTTYKVDEKKLEAILKQADSKTVVSIEVSKDSDIVVGELTGQMVKDIEGKEAAIELKTDFATYTLLAQQINIDVISKKIGTKVNLKDIKVQLEIIKPVEEVTKLVENSAKKGNFTIMVAPVEFNVKYTYDNKTEQLTKFNAFVERTITIPSNVDASKITTGIVVEADGSIRHVPTKIVKLDGKYYAKISSLTNSVYSVISNTVEFNDVNGHWAKDAVNEMGSRMVLSGTGKGNYDPNLDITRAEFAAIVVKALGIKNGEAAKAFSDVTKGDWYSDAVEAAVSYKLISGYNDGSFRPQQKISREEAMTIIEKAMKIAGMEINLSAEEAVSELTKFVDGSNVSSWARASVAAAVKAGIVSGYNGHTIAPKANITRAETAAIVRQLLQKAGLI